MSPGWGGGNVLGTLIAQLTGGRSPLLGAVLSKGGGNNFTSTLSNNMLNSGMSASGGGGSGGGGKGGLLATLLSLL
jgi:hypothetical protein